MTPDHHPQPAEDAQILFPLPLAAYLHDGDLEPKPGPGADRGRGLHPPLRRPARRDHRRPSLDIHDDLPFLLAGPFGVDWRVGHPPVEAPATSWEPTVLELGHAVAEALHLDPLWTDDA
jgi:hypothetical protein